MICFFRCKSSRPSESMVYFPKRTIQSELPLQRFATSQRKSCDEQPNQYDTHKVGHSMLHCIWSWWYDCQVGRNYQSVRCRSTMWAWCINLFSMILVLSQLGIQNDSCASLIWLSGNYLIRSVRSCIQKSGCHQFNTYIISILVIFFLQLKHHYPIVRQCLAVTSTDSDYKPVLRQFFMFYLNNYSMSSQIISANIGQWQQLLTSQIQKSNPDKLRFVFVFNLPY